MENILSEIGLPIWKSDFYLQNCKFGWTMKKKRNFMHWNIVFVLFCRFKKNAFDWEIKKKLSFNWWIERNRIYGGHFNSKSLDGDSKLLNNLIIRPFSHRKFVFHPYYLQVFFIDVIILFLFICLVSFFFWIQNYNFSTKEFFVFCNLNTHI